MLYNIIEQKKKREGGSILFLPFACYIFYSFTICCARGKGRGNYLINSILPLFMFSLDGAEYASYRLTNSEYALVAECTLNCAN